MHRLCFRMRICIVFCSCERRLKPTQRTKQLYKKIYDALSIPRYVIKKNLTHGAKNGATERQRMYHKGFRSHFGSRFCCFTAFNSQFSWNASVTFSSGVLVRQHKALCCFEMSSASPVRKPNSLGQIRQATRGSCRELLEGERKAFCVSWGGELMCGCPSVCLFGTGWFHVILVSLFNYEIFHVSVFFFQ